MHHNRYHIPSNLQYDVLPPNLENICSIRLQTIEVDDDLLPERRLSAHLMKSKLMIESWKRFRKRETCSVVSSSGALLGSNMGKHIDSHDVVIRFNDAPTGNYSADVGSKTSIRILNSQVVKNENFSINDDLYKDTINIVWDPSDYIVNLTKWSKKPDHPFFDNFIKSRSNHPEVPFYILHPQTLWFLWDQIQATYKKPIMRTPPSSGFIGLYVAIKLCSKVFVYEYVPSIRMSDNCHYYDRTKSIGCTLGDWHPLAAEKLLAFKLNQGNNYDLAVNGVIKIKGCD